MARLSNRAPMGEPGSMPKVERANESKDARLVMGAIWINFECSALIHVNEDADFTRQVSAVVATILDCVGRSLRHMGFE